MIKYKRLTEAFSGLCLDCQMYDLWDGCLSVPGVPSLSLHSDMLLLTLAAPKGDSAVRSSDESLSIYLE